MVAFASGLDCPGATQAGSSEGAEEAAVRSDSFDDHEVFVGAVGVDLDSLKEIVGNNSGVVGRAGEVANGHAGAVDLAIVAAEEHVHVLTASPMTAWSMTPVLEPEMLPVKRVCANDQSFGFAGSEEVL